jgi:subtilisin family serine protease
MTKASSPFASSTGCGVRVGVIDSGVNIRHPHIISVAGGARIESGSAISDSYVDVLGHGTAVMAAIQEKAPDAEYYAVKLFDRTLSATAASLLGAIQWCIDQELRVINLSLGTTNPQHAGPLTVLVKQAVERGIVLVSAGESNGKPYLPGSLPGVIGVCLDWNCDSNTYRAQEDADSVVFYASPYPKALPGVPREKNLHGISFAVANMAAFVIRACSLFPREPVETIRQVLLEEGRSAAV